MTRLDCNRNADYPTINWDRHAAMSERWIEIDERFRAGQPIADLLGQITYQLRLKRRWPQVDTVSMGPGVAVSRRARAVLESLGISGMRFLEFQINHESFFLFYSDRQVDCLDRVQSDIEYFQSSGRVMMVDRYVFRPGLVQQCDIFTVPESRGGMFFWAQQTFVTPAARTEIERAGLVGFWFVPLPGLVQES